MQKLYGIYKISELIKDPLGHYSYHESKELQTDDNTEELNEAFRICIFTSYFMFCTIQRSYISNI
jgi:hypothetical protein